MVSVDCSFQGHKGQLDTVSGKVVFYKLVFDDICYAIKFLSGFPPGDYTGWVIQNYFGIYDHEKLMYYTTDEGWKYSEGIPNCFYD
jgi:hypothetical protein